MSFLYTELEFIAWYRHSVVMKQTIASFSLLAISDENLNTVLFNLSYYKKDL